MAVPIVPLSNLPIWPLKKNWLHPAQRNEDFQFSKVQLALIIYGLHIYKFAYLLKLICNPKINTSGTFAVIQRHAQSSEQFVSPNTYVTS